MPRLRLFCCAVVAATVSVSAARAQSTPIHDIMTGLPNSPKLGQTVTVSGVVVGVMATGGFYITAPSSQWDSSNNTAEGMPVFAAAGATPACAVVGNTVDVAGTVVNGTQYNGAMQPATGIQPTACTVTGTGAVGGSALAMSTNITAFGQLQPYTGTPVSNSLFYVVGPTSGVLDEVNETVTSTGQFFATLTSNAANSNHVFKSVGLSMEEFYPPSAPPNIARFDGNPERIMVDTTTFGGAPFDLGVGQTLQCTAATGLAVGATKGIGVMDYSLGYARLLVFKTTSCVAAGTINASVTAPANPQHFHVGTLNLHRFYSNLPAAGAVQITLAAYQRRLQKAAHAIVDVMGKPDIVSVQEVQDLATLQDIASAATTMAGAGTTYAAYLLPGNDPQSLNLGFLINTDAAKVDSLVQLNPTDTFTSSDGTTKLLWERPPLVLDVELLRAGENYLMTVVNIHLTERAGIDDPIVGPDIRTRRGMQAEELTQFAQTEQTTGVNFMIAGEFNAYSFSDGFVDPTSVVVGNASSNPIVLYEAPHTNPALYNCVSAVLGNEKYNVIESGNARSIEHVLVTQNAGQGATRSLYSYIETITQPHFTTDFPAITANDPTTATGLTARDGFVAAFLIPPVPTTVSLTPQSLDFGSVIRGVSKSLTLTLQNTSTFPSSVNVTSLTVTGVAASDYSASSNCASVTQGATCTVTVVFAPTAAGTRGASLAVNTDAGSNPNFAVALTGIGVDTTATLTPASANFPDTDITGASAAQTFTFTNTGGIAETVSAVTVTSDFILNANGCAAVTLVPSATCSISVAFAPAAVGARTGTLTVSNSSTANPVLTATLSGNALPTTATLTPTTANFGTIAAGNTSSAQTFTWINTSNVPLKINSVTATGDFAVASTTCAGTLAAGASCTAAVAFSPTAIGARSGALSVASSSSANGTLTAALSGTGVSLVTLSSASLAFGNLDIGATSGVRSVTVTNASAVPVGITSFTTSGQYAATSTCVGTLVPGAQCVVSVVFKPTTLGAQAGTVVLATNDPKVGTLTITTTGNGVDFGIALDPTSGSLIAGYRADLKMTLTPLGGWNGHVDFRCDTGHAGGSQCMYPSGLTFSAPTTVQVGITSTSQFTVIGYTGGLGRGWLGLLGVMLSTGMLCFGRRSRLRTLAAFTAMAVLAGTGLGCSGRLPDRNADPTMPGTYTYTLTATDGFLTHSATYSLTVTAK